MSQSNVIVVYVIRDGVVLARHTSRSQLTIGSQASDLRIAGLAPIQLRIRLDNNHAVVEPLAPGIYDLRGRHVGEPTVLPGFTVNGYRFDVRVGPEYAPPPRPRSVEFVDDGQTTGDVPVMPVRYEASGEIEAGLVDRLRANPEDELAREVYADWLEHNGFGVRATFLRTEMLGGETIEPAAAVHEVGWRALVSRAPIECEDEDCPRLWSRLKTGADDLVRRCRACNRAVYYCSSLPEARLRAGEPIAIDAALVRDHVRRSRML